MNVINDENVRVGGDAIIIKNRGLLYYAM